MKYVLVTGAYGGMGRAAVRLLKESGYTVFALDRTVDKAEENVIPITADVTSEESLLAAASAVREQTNSIYAIIHFAGIYVLDSLVEMNEQAFIRAFDVNVFGAARINRIFLPLMKEGSRIVMITSELAPLQPLPFTGLYAITKSTLDKYAFSLRMELQLKNIAVIIVRPGAVKTGMLDISTSELDRFCEQTQLYSCNADRFRKIVRQVEARNVSATVVASKVQRILQSKRPRYLYRLNRNPLLLLLNILPPRPQTWIIGRILK